MTLDDIPSGSTILIDANVLIYARRGMSGQCRRLLERCAAHEVIGAFSKQSGRDPPTDICKRVAIKKQEGRAAMATAEKI